MNKHNYHSPLRKGIVTSLGLLACLLIAACKSAPSKSKETEGYSNNRRLMEEKAQRCLNSAREQVKNDNLDKAKTIIKQMRKDCYLALSARREGILLMDSIDLQQSKHELVSADSLMHVPPTDGNRQNFNEACQKVQFYERKLQYDKQQNH